MASKFSLLLYMLYKVIYASLVPGLVLGLVPGLVLGLVPGSAAVTPAGSRQLYKLKCAGHDEQVA
jgi:hypothetical protein